MFVAFECIRLKTHVFDVELRWFSSGFSHFSSILRVSALSCHLLPLFSSLYAWHPSLWHFLTLSFPHVFETVIFSPLLQWLMLTHRLCCVWSVRVCSVCVAEMFSRYSTSGAINIGDPQHSYWLWSRERGMRGKGGTVEENWGRRRRRNLLYHIFIFKIWNETVFFSIRQRFCSFFMTQMHTWLSVRWHQKFFIRFNLQN